MSGAADENRVRFETALGICELTWSPRGITRLLLPDPAAAETAQPPGAAPPDSALPSQAPAFVALARQRLRAYFASGQGDFAAIPRAAAATDFERQVYEAVGRIPAGQVLSYGAVARAIGRPGAARAVGRALGRNPTPILVPCHRVVGADGALTGFTAPGGVALKRRLLALEAGAAGRA